MLYDKDIREPLFFFLEERYGKIRILEEKKMGRSRADVIMVTEHGIYGIEIKSDADTYTRLASQAKDYDACFDYNYVVVGSSHAAHIKEHVPEHWGIITVEEVEADNCAANAAGADSVENSTRKAARQKAGSPKTEPLGQEPASQAIPLEGSKEKEIDFYIFRQPARNPQLDPYRKISILWRPEAAKIQAKYGLYKYADRSKKFVLEYLLRALPPEELWPEVYDALFERDYSLIHDQINEYRAERRKRKRIHRKYRRRKSAV